MNLYQHGRVGYYVLGYTSFNTSPARLGRGVDVFALAFAGVEHFLLGRIMVAEAEILDHDGMRRALMRIAHEIVERNHGASRLMLVGIRSRGVPLAWRIQHNIKLIEEIAVPVEILDIGLYRDDWFQRPFNPVRSSDISTTVNHRVVVLVDDVLFTGRTIRAAMDALSDYGRPLAIQLAVLVDRGHRELPIRADFVGKNIPTSRNEKVLVRLKEVDGEDRVLLSRPQDSPGDL